VPCVSLAEPSVAETIRALRGRRFAEVRLDAIKDLNEEGVKSIFSRSIRLIATFRPGRVAESARLRFLGLAAEAGAAYVDIEIEALGRARALVGAARKNGCRVIVSYHNERATPSRAALRRRINRAFAAGADLVKIACLSRGPRDNARLLGLLDDPRPMIAIGMGKDGTVTRIAAPLLGSPFTYASPAAGRETAAGQVAAAALAAVWKAIKDV
jgi:3-dehydroquinate dehydratase type I